MPPQRPKFQRINNSVRQVLRGFTKVTEEIDLANVGSRTTREREALRSIRDEWTELHRSAMQVYERFVSELQYPQGR